MASFVPLSPDSFLFLFFTFWSFKACRLKRMKKADLKCSREFTSCRNRSESQMGKDYQKAQCIGLKGLKKAWKETFKNRFSLWEIFHQNVLSTSFISCVFSELYFKTEILPWAYVSSEMNWELTRDAEILLCTLLGSFFFFPNWARYARFILFRDTDSSHVMGNSYSFYFLWKS